MSEFLLDIDDLVVEYPGKGFRAKPFRALKGVSLDIRPGETVGLVGESGSGKTTLISIIAGILSPTRRGVEVYGTDIYGMSDGGRVKFRLATIGFILQQYNLLPALTAAENAAVPLIAAGVPRAKAVERARVLLAKLGIGDQADKYQRQMSGGQQQRVAIARALVHAPRLVVCDEPTAALDAHSGRTVMELLKRVAVEPGRSVIVVTHDSRVLEYGDRTIEMADGRVTRVA